MDDLTQIKVSGHPLAARQAAQQNFSGPGLRQLPMPLPPITLQSEFARRVTAVEALKTAQRASLAELDALFATLQHSALRGDLFGVPPSGGLARGRNGS